MLSRFLHSRMKSWFSWANLPVVDCLNSSSLKNSTFSLSLLARSWDRVIVLSAMSLRACSSSSLDFWSVGSASSCGYLSEGGDLKG